MVDRPVPEPSVDVHANINFGCTQCGKCCHDLMLPLSIEEAKLWLERGGSVQLLCEGIPWPGEPPASNLHAAFKRNRSFAVSSGSLPARVLVTLAASYDGPCPNLGSDMRCGIYEERPRVCRIYPAELNPFALVMPSNKSCPPEAWDTAHRPLIRGGVLVDKLTQALIADSMAATLGDVMKKRALCKFLEICSAAMSNEGFVVFSPERQLLMDKLGMLEGALPDENQDPSENWQIVSSNLATLSALIEIGADAVLPADAAIGARYLDLNPV